MWTPARSLPFVYEGWEGYNRSLVSAVANLSDEQLAFRAGPDLRSVGEIFLHIAEGRMDWFQRINQAGCAALLDEMKSRDQGKDWARSDLADWLIRTWSVVEGTLAQWTVNDLAFTYRHEYQGTVYAESPASGRSGESWLTTSIMGANSANCSGCKASSRSS
jgi:uncharacterized damage-inducible protein DinB